MLLADVYLTSDSTSIFNFWVFLWGQNWRDVKIRYIRGHADFCNPSVETGILYRVPEPSERVCCLFMANQQSKSAGTLLPLAMHNIDSGT